MKTFLATLLLMVLSAMLSAQYTFEGTVVDMDTNDPIDYVNIGIIGKAIGTVSLEDGNFLLELTEEDVNAIDSIQFSRIGYESLKFTTADFFEQLKEDNTIRLSATLLELTEVVIVDRRIKQNRMGYYSSSKKTYAYWKNLLAGGEHASRIRLKGKPQKLQTLSYNVAHNEADSILIRVNVYDVKKGLPGKKLVKRNIYHTIKAKEGKESIDLSPYNIIVEDDYVASLEFLKVYGENGDAGISAYYDGKGVKSYKRFTSQDKWERVRNGVSIALTLIGTEVFREGNRFVTGRVMQREIPDSLKILWDNSSSMRARKLDKELNLLGAYFKELENVHVTFQTFGYELGEEEKFSIENGDWSRLKNRIRSMVYDGGNRMETAKKINIDHQTLLFTDGIGLDPSISNRWSQSVFTISSSRSTNSSTLEAIARDTDGHFIDLNSLNIATALVCMKEYVNDDLENEKTVTSKKEKLREIRGYVMDFDNVLPDVQIRVLGSKRETVTNENGSFLISAQTNDTLRFEYGSEVNDIIVKDNLSRYTVLFSTGVTALDEVVVQADKKESKSASKIRGIKVKTLTGELDPEKIGFGVNQLSGDDIVGANATLWDAIRGKFAGVRLVGPPRGQVVSIGISTDYAGWDIDGNIYDAQTSIAIVPTVDPNQVKNLTIVPPGWAGARYGTIGRGGMVIVRTLNQSFDEGEQEQKKPENIYNGDAVPVSSVNVEIPIYVKRMQDTRNDVEAYQVYLEEKVKYGKAYDFYYDSFRFFLGKQKREKAKKILSNIEELFAGEASALRFLAYAWEEAQEMDEAFRIYEKIYKLYPSEAQSVRDLANGQRKKGNPKEAWRLYRKYINQSASLNTEGIEDVIRQESLQLIRDHQDKLRIDPADLELEETGNSAELIFEWNEPDAEFELQFVNPENLYYDWNHTKNENPEIFEDQKVKGYASYNFSIDELGTKEWLVNITRFGKLPLHLKVTIRKDKVEKEKLITLEKKDIKYKLFSVSLNNIIFH